MRYYCKTENGISYAVIEDEDDNELDRVAGENKHLAMGLRDRASNAGVAKFAHLDNPPPPAPAPALTVEAEAAFRKFDRDDNGKPGGSKPKPKPRAKAKAPAGKPKRHK